MLSKWSMVSSLGRNKSFSLEATKHSTVPSFNEFMLSNSIKRLSTEARMFSKKPRTSLAGASCKTKYDYYNSIICLKVHIFREGHKILRNLPLTFDCMYCSQK